MKKLIFGLIFALSVIGIWQNSHKLSADIFSLTQTSLAPQESMVISNLQESMKNNAIILIKNQDDAKKIKDIIKQSQIFTHEEEFNLNGLSDILLALLDKNSTISMKQNAHEFFTARAKMLFSPIKTLPLSEDFFLLSKNLNLNFGAKFDLDSGFLRTKNYYMINAKLAKDYSSDDLLSFVSKIKKFPDVHISLGALYEAHAKKTAMSESTIFGAISLLATLIFIWLGFGNVRIFYIGFIIVFGLSCGLCATLLIFDRVHFLTIVISTSLVGLIVDYSMHFLSANMQKSLLPKLIKPMLKIFLAGLFVTCGGYSLFMFSSMKFLHEIAVISIFSLLGAFFGTYYLFPILVKGAVFKSSKIFEICFERFFKFCSYFAIKSNAFMAILAVLVIGCYGGFGLSKLSFKDNIKNYHMSSGELNLDSLLISKEVNQAVGTKFILVDQAYEQQLLDELKRKKLAQFLPDISSVFNSDKTQIELKTLFKKASKDQDIIKIYEDVGVDKSALEAEFAKISSLQIYAPKAACIKLLGQGCEGFFSGDKRVLYLSSYGDEREFKATLAKYGATYSDYIQSLNDGFTQIKVNAIYLKILGFILAFVFLWLFFGIKKSALITMSVCGCSVFSILVFGAFGREIDIFIIFGLILGSAVGIDYLLFAINDDLCAKRRVQGIVMASMTSIISFSTLALSSTKAVFSFGVSVSLTILICAFASSILGANLKE